jgi:hypothetical protein
VTGPIADAVVGRAARRDVPRMEEQVRQLGRAFGAHAATPANKPEES